MDHPIQPLLRRVYDVTDFAVSHPGPAREAPGGSQKETPKIKGWPVGQIPI